LYFSGVCKSEYQPNCYPSRLDYAMDFSCPLDYFPRHFIEDCRPWLNTHCVGIGVHTAGPEFEGTRYIGSRSSERMIRIYRKDLEDKLIARTDGPVLRIELEAKGFHSKRIFFDGYKSGYNQAVLSSLQHCQLLTGVYFGAHPSKLKNSNRLKNTNGFKRVYSLLNQYGPVISALMAAGVDLKGLSALKSSYSSNESRRRARRLVESLGDIAELNESLASALV